MSDLQEDEIYKKAHLKTVADYALMLEHTKGYSEAKSRRLAYEGVEDELYKKLFFRNIQLFKDGSICFFV